MKTTKPKLMTAEQFVRDYGDQYGFELVLGQLVETPMPGFDHGEVCMNTNLIFGQFIKSKKLGRLASNDTLVRVHANPASYRGPDLLYISYKTLPKKIPTATGPLEVAPDLVVEVRSPTDRLKQVQAKGREYLDAGVKVVVIIDPETESLGVFREEELPIRFHNGDIVTIPDVLPGFAVPLKEFFQ